MSTNSISLIPVYFSIHLVSLGYFLILSFLLIETTGFGILNIGMSTMRLVEQIIRVIFYILATSHFLKCVKYVYVSFHQRDMHKKLFIKYC